MCRRPSTHGGIEPLEVRRLLSRTIYVDTNSPGPARDGSSWASAYADLQLALAGTSSGDQVRVADGNYIANTTGGRAATFLVKRETEVRGGYAGYGAPNPDARDPGGTPSVLNSPYSGQARTVSASDAYGTLLDGFTVRSPGFGAVGIFINNGTPTVTNCIFEGGMGIEMVGGSLGLSDCLFAELDGDDAAGITISSASATIRNCDFIDCHGREGGAIRSDKSSLTVSQCDFVRNNAAHEGMALFLSQSPSTFTDCEFVSNGNGIDPDDVITNRGGDLTFTRCTFFRNRGGSFGGAISGGGGLLTLTDCTFRRNYASYAGAAILHEGGGPVTLTNCIFEGNSVYGFGGAVYIASADARITNCVFGGNDISEHGGGALYVSSGTATVTNCTFSGNVAERGAGGAIMLRSVVLNLRNSILWGDSAADGNEIAVVPDGMSTLNFEHSAVQGYPRYGQPFVRQPNPGADGYFGSDDDDYGDLRLRIDARAASGDSFIDAGDNFLVPGGITTDLAGNHRFVDMPGINDPGGIVDLGAYEYVLPLAATSGAYLYDAAAPGIGVAFNGDIAASTISASDLILLDPATNQPIPEVPAITASYDPSRRTAGWAFAVPLPNGNYRAKIATGSLADLRGNSLAAEFTFDFFVLAGDANRDRVVDITDLGILATNWQQPLRTFSQGDFNYDGTVDLADLGILATNWQKNVPALAPSPGEAARSLARPHKRLIDTIDDTQETVAV